MVRSGPKPFHDVDLLTWRCILRILHSPWFAIPYGIVSLVSIFIFHSLRLSPPLPTLPRLRATAFDKGCGLGRRTKRWNRRFLAQARSQVRAIRQRRQWLEANLLADRDLESEKQRLVCKVAEHLERHGEWLKIGNAQARSLACADALDTPDATIRAEVMALSVETIRRKLDGIMLHDSQLLAACCLADNMFVELRNGEGKTFAAIPAMTWAAVRLQAARAVAKRHNVAVPFGSCFCFTANGYLVRRDYVWLKEIYAAMGISAAYIDSSLSSRGARCHAYTADIVFMEGTDYGFDSLRNSCRPAGMIPIPQAPYYVLIDEADQLLLDEARTPLILSGEAHIRSAAFVKRQWVTQVNHWIRDVFLDNQFLTSDDDGMLRLTMGGRIYLRTVLSDYGIVTTQGFAELLRAHHWDVVVSLLGELLVKVPGLAKQMKHEDRESLANSILSRKQLLQVAGNGSAKVSLTAEGRSAIWTLLSSIGQPVSPADFRHLLAWALEQRVESMGVEAARVVRSIGRRRLLRTLTKLYFRKEYCVDLIESALQIVASSSSVPVPEGFAAGLTLLLEQHAEGQRGSHDQIQNWLVFHGIAGAATLLSPLTDEALMNRRSGKRGDLGVLVACCRMITSLQRPTYEHSERVREMVRGFALFGALVRNFLFLPETGVLTSAGRRVAYFIEEQCRQRGLAEGLTTGAVADLIQTALYAYVGRQEGRDYIVAEGRVTLVNQITGRPEPTKHFGRALHPFVQAKHGLEIVEPMPTLRTITFQNLARRFPRMAGMSGTLVCEEHRLRTLYARQTSTPLVVAVPPHVAPAMVWDPLVLCGTKEAKWRAISAKIISHCQSNHQPILVITSSVDDSESLGAVLRTSLAQANIAVTLNVLNATCEEREEEVVSWAGQSCVVTIATQMAARGTDIVLSGEAVRNGGLYVIIAEHHEAERLDNQAEGRCARHGDPGRIRYFVAFDDPLQAPLRGNRLSAWAWEQLISGGEGFVEIEGKAALSIQEGFANAQSEIQLRQHRIRQIAGTLDAVSDGHREAALQLRECFVSGRLNTVVAGTARLAQLCLDDIGLARTTPSLDAAARLMAGDIINGGANAADLIHTYMPQLGFAIPEASLQSIVDAYHTQLTPYLDVPESETPVSVRNLVLDAIVAGARDADVASVQRRWPQLVARFHLSRPYHAPHWEALLDHLDGTLVLGYGVAARTRAEATLKRLTPDARTSPAGWADLMRQAVIEGIVISGTEPAYRLSDTDAPSQAPATRLFGVQVAGTRQEIMAAIAIRLQKRFADDPDALIRFCREFLALFDEHWERALDDLYLLEDRMSRESDGLFDWGDIFQDVGNIMRRTLSTVAHRAFGLLEHYDLSEALEIPLPQTTRWLPVGVTGPSWFLHEPLAFSSLEEPEPPEYCSQASQPAANANIWTGGIQLYHTGPVLGSWLTMSTSDADANMDELQLDALLLGEYAQDSSSSWIEAAERYRTQEDRLIAAACLDGVEASDLRVAHLRTLIFEDLGCREKELEYLRLLDNAGNLEIRLRLRMTYLLSHGTPVERRQAIFILMQDAVPEKPSSNALDYSPVQALTTAVAQLLEMREYDNALRLYLHKHHVLGPPSLRHVTLYESIAEATRNSSRIVRDEMSSYLGCDLNAWLHKLLVALYHCCQQEKDAEQYILDEPKVDRAMILLATACEDKWLVQTLVRKVVRKMRDQYKWGYLSDLFGSAGRDFERRLFLSRHAIYHEDYETALEALAAIRGTDPDEEVCTCTVYALLGLARCYASDLHGQHVARQHLLSCVEILSEHLGRHEDVVAANLLMESHCRLGNFEQAIAVGHNHGVADGAWYARARVMAELADAKAPSRALDVLAQVAHWKASERAEAYSVLNSWLSDVHETKKEWWLASETADVLRTLERSWDMLLEDTRHFHGFWDAGISLRLAAERLAEHKQWDQALDILRRVVQLWEKAILLTHEASPPYKSLLSREDHAARQAAEVSLRRCMRQIRDMEERIHEAHSAR